MLPGEDTQNDSEEFYYQHLVLYMPFAKYKDLTDFYEQHNSNWRDSFFAAAQSLWRNLWYHKFRHSESEAFRLSGDKIASIRKIDADIQSQSLRTERPVEMDEQNLSEMLASANPEQLNIYNTIVRILGVHVVYGAAGTGKSYLLNMIATLRYLVSNYEIKRDSRK
ncbi:hypothetical protein INT48_006025 [Thamnidium elegans]|uniref:ATP-dependent DNA helicase n=1 Tax=Thamnidium elegans TaxID=101142 RepID=A0A8H7VMR5_9FUNG|nr:hypothetical protein INT48_006025 [Thamnidium elegans]